MKWGLIEYEAEKLVPRRQKWLDIGCCLVVLVTVFWAAPWVSSLIIESGALK